MSAKAQEDNNRTHQADLDLTALEVKSIELVNGLLGQLGRRQQNRAASPRIPIAAVHNVGAQGLEAVLLEKVLQVLPRHRVRQLSMHMCIIEMPRFMPPFIEHALA